jgi:prophage regulatory protein
MSARFFAESQIIERTQMESSVSKRTSADPADVIFLRLPDVKAMTGLSKSSRYALIRANSFPAPVQLAPRTVGWVRSEVNQWATDRILSSRSASSHQDSRLKPNSALRPALTPSRRRA